jgi:hypothetical protein
MSFQTFGFGQNDKNVGRKTSRLKLDANQHARISFLWWPGLDEGKPDLDAPTPMFVGAPRHYMKGVGYFINNGPAYTDIAGEAPKMRINTICVSWPMKGARLDKNGIENGDFEVLYWVMADSRYNELKAIHGEWPLGQHDIKIKCSDAQYQKMTFQPTKESILRMLVDSKGYDNEIVKEIIREGQRLMPTVRDEIGRDLSIEQIREKLSGAPGGGGSPVGSGPAGGAAVDGEIDDALDNLLDD